MRRGSVSGRREAIERDLDLYYDGELRGFRKWRFERLLRRNPGLRRELETRGQVGALLREAAPEPEAPDLWAGIAAEIAVADGPRRGTVSEATPSAWLEWLQPLRLGPVLVGAAAILAFLIVPPSDDPVVHAQGVVRSIVSKGKPVVVLDDSDEATIIWFMDNDVEAAEEVVDGVRV